TIASIIFRASAKGLPWRLVGRGSMSSISDHWASESTWNLDISPASQYPHSTFVRHALVHGRRDATVDVDIGPVDEVTAGAGEHRDRVGDVVYLTDPPDSLADALEH